MKRILTTAALVLSLGLTSLTASTAPAQAASDREQILTALGVLALFAYAANEARDDRKERVHRPAPKRFSKVLPRRCLVVTQSRQGNQRVFGKRCLQNNYAHVNRLPRFCETKVRVRGDWRTAYNARCLRNEGFTRA